MSRKRQKLLVMIVCLCLTLILVAHAAAKFPSRRIQLLYPWAAGQTTYVVSQLAAEQMGKALGQKVVITSNTGAGGVKCAMAVKSKPANGYTIFDGWVAPLIVAPLFGKTKYTWRDWEPLYCLATNAFAIACRVDEKRWTDVKSWIEYMKANPGLKYSGGPDTALPHLVIATVLQQIGVVGRNIPYPGLGAGLKDLLAGEVDWALINPGMWRTAKEEIRVLAICSDEPLTKGIYPDNIPTIKEAGYPCGLPGISPQGWDWWVVKKGTPKDVLTVLRNAMATVFENKELLQKYVSWGYEPRGFPPEEYEKRCTEIENAHKKAISAVEWEKEQIKKMLK